MTRNSFYFFALLALFAIPAFWPSYLSRIGAEPQIRVHLHGAVMAAWLLLLIAQAFLIRSGRRTVHRALGKVSYVLAPLIVLAMLTLGHYRIQESKGELPADFLYFFYVQWALLSLFVISYALAIYNRKTPQVHARFMACTALAVFDPIFARLIYNNLGIDIPLTQVLTYGFVDGVLLLLSIVDWRRGFRPPVFPAMLVLFVVAELPTFFVYKLPAWREFTLWYGGLPIP